MNFARLGSVRRWGWRWLAATGVIAATSAHGQSLLPTTPGTTWQYEVKEERAGAKDAHKGVGAVLIRRIADKELFDGKDALRVETVSNGHRETDLLTVVDAGLSRVGRSDRRGNVQKMGSPEIIVPTPIVVGTEWETGSNGPAGQTRQHCRVERGEDVTVPAGEFRAFRFHTETLPHRLVVTDRWFVPGIGFVQETRTTRARNGKLVRRVTLQLKAAPDGTMFGRTSTSESPSPTVPGAPAPTATANPEPTATPTSVPAATATPRPRQPQNPTPTATSTPVPAATLTPTPTSTPIPSPTPTPRPTPTPTQRTTPTPTLTSAPTLTAALPPTATLVTTPTLSPAPDLAGKISIEISDQPNGESRHDISSASENIYARWRGRGLGPRAKIRVVWVAEDVGDVAPPNYEIDDASTIASDDAHGMFTLSQPLNGWAPGRYRVEVYLDGALAASAHVQIAK